MNPDGPDLTKAQSLARLHRIVSHDGVTLAADDLGPFYAPAVVLLHGGGQTRHSWSGAWYSADTG